MNAPCGIREREREGITGDAQQILDLPQTLLVAVVDICTAEVEFQICIRVSYAAVYIHLLKSPAVISRLDLSVRHAPLRTCKRENINEFIDRNTLPTEGGDGSD